MIWGCHRSFLYSASVPAVRYKSAAAAVSLSAINWQLTAFPVRRFTGFPLPSGSHSPLGNPFGFSLPCLLTTASQKATKPFSAKQMPFGDIIIIVYSGKNLPFNFNPHHPAFKTSIHTAGIIRVPFTTSSSYPFYPFSSASGEFLRKLARSSALFHTMFVKLAAAHLPKPANRPATQMHPA